MGKRADYFGKSQYFGADEMASKTLRLTIIGAEDAEFEKDGGKVVLKPVLSFRNEERKLVVGAMNYDRLADAFGDETKDWVGRTVILRGERVLFRGKRVNSIIAEPVRQRTQPAPKQEAPDDFDDGMPDDFAA
jgi:hypothetical protein